ncbi:hypothetical protein PHMEG_00037934 [Phytophthora megakarya]|uniref:Uncharacterized protein n=1 Tax=Phytophthora megakarya TaxID=4795 RepID=A0A225UJZ4_9STRA|nr:hypothetical protein PHMEG_00037934 [Phytophthora megakarya]
MNRLFRKNEWINGADSCTGAWDDNTRIVQVRIRRSSALKNNDATKEGPSQNLKLGRLKPKSIYFSTSQSSEYCYYTRRTVCPRTDCFLDLVVVHFQISKLVVLSVGRSLRPSYTGD